MSTLYATDLAHAASARVASIRAGPVWIALLRVSIPKGFYTLVYRLAYNGDVAIICETVH